MGNVIFAAGTGTPLRGVKWHDSFLFEHEILGVVGDGDGDSDSVSVLERAVDGVGFILALHDIRLIWMFEAYEMAFHTPWQAVALVLPTLLLVSSCNSNHLCIMHASHLN